MKFVSRIGTLVVMTLLATGTARAAIILDVSGAVSAADPIQLGRLSRNGLPQDWTGVEPYPGIVNPLVPYHYRAYSVNVGITPYVQISFDSLSANTFVSAYDTSYAPGVNFALNWLGDPGNSANAFGTDPLFFQVVVPLNHNLLIIVNNTGAADLGVGDPFRILAEGFIDTEFTDPPARVPEPATLLLGCVGAVAVGLRRRFVSTARK